MSGIGTNSDAADMGKSHIIEGNEARFMEEVIEASATAPVIVDFWAPWCGPCKTLGPALEAAVNKRRGKVSMVKINVDENPSISAQLQIQSIPTVYAFRDGRPVDAFQGAQSPAQIEEFLDRLLADAPKSPIDQALEQAEGLADAGEYDAAARYFEAVLAQEPGEARAKLGLAGAHIEMGDLEAAQKLLDELGKAQPPLGGDEQKKLELLLARIKLMDSARDAGPVDALLAKVKDNPDDHQAYHDAASALFGNGRTGEALDLLLESFRRDREWNEGATRARLIEMFDAMDAKDPALGPARRKFSGMVFS